ncbi:hypothetical protein IAR55_002961 [Kwoniella newhampshirensis]|uniref:Proteasome maturation protein n=1 Tax=Kwoniella newhampshirensis TaxID=1651941 RepID=A0AAW0Z0E8_9TREE
MSLRLVPASAQTSNDAHIVSTQATAHSISGTHDAFRHGLKSAAQTVSAETASPLQARLEKWATTQQQLQQNMQRNTFGLAVPLRQAMELKLVSESLHNPLLDSSSSSGIPLGGSHNLSLEILQGKDESLEENEFMGGDKSMAEVLDVNGTLERSRGI